MAEHRTLGSSGDRRRNKGPRGPVSTPDGPRKLIGQPISPTTSSRVCRLKVWNNSDLPSVQFRSVFKRNGGRFPHTSEIESMLVRDVMRKPISVHAEETLEVATLRLKKENVGALPVVEDDQVVCRSPRLEAARGEMQTNGGRHAEISDRRAL